MSSYCGIILKEKDYYKTFIKRYDAVPERMLNTLDNEYYLNKLKKLHKLGGVSDIKKYPITEEITEDNIHKYMHEGWYIYHIYNDNVDVYGSFYPKKIENGKLITENKYLLLGTYILSEEYDYDTDDESYITWVDIKNNEKKIENKFNAEFFKNISDYDISIIKKYASEYIYFMLNQNEKSIGMSELVELSMQKQINMFEPYKVLYDIVEKNLNKNR